MEKDCYILEKTLSFLTLPCGTASEPDVNSFPAKGGGLLHHPSLIFPLKYAYVCVLPASQPIPPSNIYFPLSYPQKVLLVCGKPPSLALLTCCLLSFGHCSVIFLHHSYIPSDTPPAIFFPSSPLRPFGLV